MVPCQHCLVRWGEKPLGEAPAQVMRERELFSTDVKEKAAVAVCAYRLFNQSAFFGLNVIANMLEPFRRIELKTAIKLPYKES